MTTVFTPSLNSSQFVHVGVNPVSIKVPKKDKYVRLSVPKSSHVIFVAVNGELAMVPTADSPGAMPVIGGEGVPPTVVFVGSAEQISIVAEVDGGIIVLTSGDML